jgi:pyruvate dehydrogenase E2 component (dihydrolipoamide acetyltransferase)
MPDPNLYEFKMPSLGADMDKAKLVEWKVRPGDRVKKGDIVAVIETTKSAVDVEVFREGVVEKLVVNPGEEQLPVGTVLALIRSEGGPA